MTCVCAVHCGRPVGTGISMTMGMEVGMWMGMGMGAQRHICGMGLGGIIAAPLVCVSVLRSQSAVHGLAHFILQHIQASKLQQGVSFPAATLVIVEACQAGC